jgi:hypothetical protein
MINGDDCGAVGGMGIDRGNRSNRRKPASATLSTTNPTLLDLGSNPDRRGGKSAINCISYGTAEAHPTSYTKATCGSLSEG